MTAAAWVYRVTLREIRAQESIDHQPMTVGADNARQARAMVERHAGRLLERRGVRVIGTIVTTGAKRIGPYVG